MFFQAINHQDIDLKSNFPRGIIWSWNFQVSKSCEATLYFPKQVTQSLLTEVEQVQVRARLVFFIECKVQRQGPGFLWKEVMNGSSEPPSDVTAMGDDNPGRSSSSAADDEVETSTTSSSFSSSPLAAMANSDFRTSAGGRGSALPTATPSSPGCGCVVSPVTDPEITISITPTTGGQFDLTVDRNETIENLKKIISKRLKVAKERICLLHRERWVFLSLSLVRSLGCAREEELARGKGCVCLRKERAIRRWWWCVSPGLSNGAGDQTSRLEKERDPLPFYWRI